MIFSRGKLRPVYVGLNLGFESVLGSKLVLYFGLGFGSGFDLD